MGIAARALVVTAFAMVAIAGSASTYSYFWQQGIPVNKHGQCPNWAYGDDTCVPGKGIRNVCCTPGWVCEAKNHHGWCVHVTKHR